jgi:hypothetical protein
MNYWRHPNIKKALRIGLLDSPRFYVLFSMAWAFGPYKALFGYSQYKWIGWDWKKFLRSLTCLGFKLIQSHSIHMD